MHRYNKNNKECTDSTCNNKWYTHPAFTFGEEEIEGFWIGKFELSVPENDVCYTNESSSNCNKTGITPLVKPNVKSYRIAQVGTFATNIMAMNDSSNIYGFSTSTDTHMIKNMEWGAVAYLSHSKYGTCTDGVCEQVYINNCSNFITGIGADTADEAESTATCTTAKNKYNGTSGVKASTTHNIYGVYDMSGDSNEYVMGNIMSIDGVTMMTGYTTSENSGYTGIIYDEGIYTSYTGTYNYPDDKYIDKYSFGSKDVQIFRSKLGDAIKEVYNVTDDENWQRSWYGNFSYVSGKTRAWIYRGGTWEQSEMMSGIFCSYRFNGHAGPYYSTRLIITP